MKWYKRDPDAARLALLRKRYGNACCGEFPQPAHIPHFVYVIGRPGGPAKVGLCRDLGRRVRSLQTACPFQVDLFWSALVRSREIAREIELLAFARFPRTNGEWVSADPGSVAKFLEAQ